MHSSQKLKLMSVSSISKKGVPLLFFCGYQGTILLFPLELKKIYNCIVLYKQYVQNLASGIFS